jgi:hypothetical protein
VAGINLGTNEVCIANRGALHKVPEIDAAADHQSI